MGGWITIGISALATYSFYRIDQTFLMILSIANTGLSFWSFGVMHNYALDTSKSKAKILRENMRVEGRLDEQAEKRLNKHARRINPSAAPNWAISRKGGRGQVCSWLLPIFFKSQEQTR